MEALSFEIKAELDKMNRGLAKASASIEKFSKNNEARLKKFAESSKRIGKQLSVRLSAPLALLAGNAVRTFASFDDQMRKVGATMGATTDELSQMTDIAKELGSTTRFTAREAAEGLEFMALAGFNAKQSIEAIPDVLNLAAAAAIDLGLASDIVTDTMSAFSLSADQAANVSDVLAKTQASANATVVQLGESFKFSTANAATFGQDLETLSAVLGVFADSGVKGSRAGTAFNAIIRDLKKESKDGAVAIAGQNIALADSEGNFRDLLEIMSDVEKATSSLSQAQQASALDAVFQEEAIRGVNILMTQGVGKAENLRKKLYEAGGSAKDMAEQMEGGLGGAMRSLSAAFEGFNIELGQILAPLVQKVAGYLSNLLKGFQDLSPEVKRVLVVVAGLAAAVGPLLLALGGIVSILPAILTGLSVLTGPIGLIIAGVVALGVAIYKNWDIVKKWAEDIANYFINLYNESLVFRSGIEYLILNFKNLWEVVSFVAKSIWTVLKTTFNNLINVFTSFGTVLKGVLTFDTATLKRGVTDFAKNLKSNLTGAIDEISENAETLFNNVGKNAKEAIDNILGGKKDPVKFDVSEESKKKLEDDVADAVSKGASKGMGRPQQQAVSSLSPVGVQQGGNNIDGDLFQRENIKENLNGITEEMLMFNEDMNSLINGTMASTFSNLGTNIGNALANGTSVVSAIGQTLTQSFGRFLSDMGDLLIEYGLFAKAKGALDTAIATGGPVAIAAGAAAVAVGVALKAAGAAIGNRSQGGFSGSTGAGASSAPQTQNLNQTASQSNSVLRLVARGEDLVSVIDRVRASDNLIGG